jgi:glycosyltransferase involved in cell wall biosynthesis
MKKIAIVTPVKNEMENLPELFECMEAQSYPVSLWIIINDNSTDGSGDFIEENIKKLKNVKNAEVVHAEHLDKDYRLGSKYSQVINFGFTKFNELKGKYGESFDFIGILDADCFIEKDYYKKLIERFSILPKLGIGSGVIYYRTDTGTEFDKMPLRWARGAIRLWRMECFNDAGYMVGNAADALSSALAWTRGWESQSFKEIRAESRVMGKRTNPQYYGETAYYRYNPHYYIFMKFFVMVIRSGFIEARDYYRGFLNAKKKKIRANVDRKVKFYFRTILFRNIIENLIVLKNYRAIKKKIKEN